MFLGYRARLCLNVPEAGLVLMVRDCTHWEEIRAMRFVGGKGQVGDLDRFHTMSRETQEEVGLEIDPEQIQELESYINRLHELVYTGVVDIDLVRARAAASRMRGRDVPALVSYDEIEAGTYGNVPVHDKCRSIFQRHVLPRYRPQPVTVAA